MGFFQHLNALSLFEQAFLAVISGSVTFRLGDYSISVTEVNGSPAKLTFGAAALAAEKVAAGQAGQFQSGDVQVTVTHI